MECDQVMEKISHIWTVKNYSATKEFKVGQYIESGVISAPGDYSFKLFWFPRGKHQLDHLSKSARVRVENASKKRVKLVLSVELLGRSILPPQPEPLKRSSFEGIESFREVDSLAPGHGLEFPHVGRSYLKSMPGDYIWRDSIMIRVTIGIFRETVPPQPFDPFVFIKVGSVRFYAEQSVLKARCPALLPDPDCSTATTVEIRNMEPDTFGPVLWYIYHKKLHYENEIAISETLWRDPDSLGMKMFEAARRLNLRHLMRLINELIQFGCTFAVDCGIFGDIFRGLKKCAAKPDKMKVKQTVIETKATTTYADGGSKMAIVAQKKKKEILIRQIAN